MPKKVLIAYGSRYGSTAKIARTMAQTLENEGLEPQLLDLNQTNQKQWPSLASYDGLLVGSGIKIGRWTGEATKFLKKHADEIKTLKSKGLVVGFRELWKGVDPRTAGGARQEVRQEDPR